MHVKQVVNGQGMELNLCSQCAAKLGYAEMVNAGSFNIGDLLGSMLGFQLPQSYVRAPAAPAERCPVCGAAYSDLVQSGKAGCANCYSVFGEGLGESVARIHGNVTHEGKLPGRAGKHLKSKRETERLEKELKAAIGSQEFERAAELRDKLRELKGGESA